MKILRCLVWICCLAGCDVTRINGQAPKPPTSLGIGGEADPNRMVFISSAFTGAIDSDALGVGTILTVPTDGEASGIKVNPTLIASAGQVASRLVGIQVAPTFVSGGGTGTTLGAQGMFIRSFAVPAALAAPEVAGLAIDSPSGGMRNYSLMLSGPVQLRGTTALQFEQLNGVVDAYITGAPSVGAYTPGSQIGDLVFRATNHHMLWTDDAGNHTRLFLGEGKFGIGTTGPLALLSVGGAGSASYTADITGTLHASISVATPIVGYGASSLLAIVANVISPTNAIHHVGAGLVKTITVPAACTPTCQVTIIPDAAYTTDATGNISVASTAVTNRAMTFTWDGAKWNPSY